MGLQNLFLKLPDSACSLIPNLLDMYSCYICILSLMETMDLQNLFIKLFDSACSLKPDVSDKVWLYRHVIADGVYFLKLQHD